MPDYPFRDVDTGKQVTLEFALGEGPDIGVEIRRGARRLVRIAVEDAEKPDWGDREAARARIREEQARVKAPKDDGVGWHVGWVDRTVVDPCLHRWHPYAEAYDSTGRPVMKNRAAYKELVKRHNSNPNAIQDLVLDD